MTKELAIRVLTGDVLGTTEQTQEAVKIAVEALSEPPGKDPIEREAVVEILHDAMQGCGESEENLIGEIVCKVDLLPSAQPEHQWIPWNSGKFPEESGTYAVTAYDGAIKRVTCAKYQKRLKRWEWTGARAYWRVLAWMPLPEPYKERREE